MNFFCELFHGWLPRNPSKYSSYGYVRTEYWESGEGLWVFTALKSGWREDERVLLREVWEKVKALEHAPGEDEDQEVREAVRTLYQLKKSIDSDAAWAEFAEEFGQD